MTTEKLRTTVVVFAPGEFVVGNREDFKALLSQLGDTNCDVIVDFRDVGYCDSAALGALVSVARRFAKAGLGFVCCSLNDDIAVLFDLTKMEDVLLVAATIEEARGKLGAKPPDIPPDEGPPTLTLHR